MQQQQILELLRAVENGKLSADAASVQLRDFPFHKTQVGLFDNARDIRRGIPEAIFCLPKSDEQILELFLTQAQAQGEKGFVLATHVQQHISQKILEQLPTVQYYHQAKVLFYGKKKPPIPQTKLIIITAGTSDLHVAHEIQVCAELMGNSVSLLPDLGVAALNRILDHLPQVRSATCVIVVAGMDGALPSVVSGLTRIPVIAVPTNSGYGTALHGISALLAMLNSCSPGLAVMNIGNGYGAACFATLLHQTIHECISKQQNLSNPI